jgi:hypothetical protein
MSMLDLPKDDLPKELENIVEAVRKLRLQPHDYHKITLNLKILETETGESSFHAKSPHAAIYEIKAAILNKQWEKLESPAAGMQPIPIPNVPVPKAGFMGLLKQGLFPQKNKKDDKKEKAPSPKEGTDLQNRYRK